MSNLITLIPLKSIVVVRDNKMVVPPVDKPFGFTESEVADAGPDAFRKPVNEAPAEAEEVAEKPVSKPAAKTAGKGAKNADEGL